MQLTQIAIDLLSQLGYGGLAAGLVLDSFGIPIPSEVLLLFGGALAGAGRFNIWVVLALGTLAQLVGGLIGYAIGRYGGLPILERYGKYILVTKKDLAKTHAAFEKYGPFMTMIGRCLPVIRGLIAYPAGIAGMRLDKFIIYTTLGSFIWSALWVWIGYTVGTNLEVIEPWINQITIVIVLLAVTAVVWHFREPLRNLWVRPTKPDDLKE